MRGRAKQLDLFARWARKRRKAKAPAKGGSKEAKDGYLPHVARPTHHKDCPVHVSMRRVAVGPSFRTQRICAAIRGQIAGAKRKGVRVIDYSVQDNHLHLMVEGSDSADLSNQMRNLFSRIAMTVNALTRRHGKLFRDRHHRHELKTPREVRNALVYILFNDRKHRGAAAAGAASTSAAPTLDPCSSVWWFHDWAPWDSPPRELLHDRVGAPTSPPQTWLARYGWRRGLGANRDGRLRFSESPRTSLKP